MRGEDGRRNRRRRQTDAAKRQEDWSMAQMMQYEGG